MSGFVPTTGLLGPERYGNSRASPRAFEQIWLNCFHVFTKKKNTKTKKKLFSQKKNQGFVNFMHKNLIKFLFDIFVEFCFTKEVLFV